MQNDVEKVISIFFSLFFRNKFDSPEIKPSILKLGAFFVENYGIIFSLFKPRVKNFRAGRKLERIYIIN